MSNRKRIGVVFIALGIFCIAGALGLTIHNERQQRAAENAAERILPDVEAAVEAERQTRTDTDAWKPDEGIQVDGEWYLGFLTIPNLDLVLPVIRDWDETKLEEAPCHYAGSFAGSDLVIAGHRYRRYFKRLETLDTGSEILFTDGHGVVHRYEVELIETLDDTEVERMVESRWDLTLFTCTYGGGKRVAVRCMEKE